MTPSTRVGIGQTDPHAPERRTALSRFRPRRAPARVAPAPAATRAAAAGGSIVPRALRALPVAALILALTACATTPAETAEPCAPGAVQIGSSADELQNALDGARPGDVLQLAETTCAGRFEISVSGTAAEPITLCGGDAAVLDGGSRDGGYALHLDGADHWVLDGFSVTGAAKGLMLDALGHNVLPV